MIITIVGPTGVGKTRMSIELAKKYNAEIINADSMQVYKGLNIGTAKINNKEGIEHHLIDIKDVCDEYSVYEYQRDARSIIDKLLKENKNIIIVGGTGLYIKSILYDYVFKEETLKDDYSEVSDEDIYQRILSINDKILVDKNNRRRLVRLLNKLENNSYSKSSNEIIYNSLNIGLTTSRDKLYSSINNRVDKMIEDGLEKEARNFYDKGINSRAINTAIGYKELYLYFDGKISLDVAIDLIKKRSRHYAKRQYTWFNNQMSVKWFDVDFNDFNNTVNKVIDYINESAKENI